MVKKYEFTGRYIDSTKLEDGDIYTGKVHQIRALIDFDDIKVGDLGGYIETEENLSHEGNAWVYGIEWNYWNTMIHQNVKISGNAKVYGDVALWGDLHIDGNKKVYKVGDHFYRKNFPISIEIESLKKNILLSELVNNKDDYKTMGITRMTKKIKEYKICVVSMNLINRNERACMFDLERVVMGDSSGEFHMFEKKARNKKNVEYKVLNYLRGYLNTKLIILPNCKVNIKLVYPSINDNLDVVKFAYREAPRITQDTANNDLIELKMFGGVPICQN